MNVELGQAFSVNPETSDYTNIAKSLAVNIKHLPENCGESKIVPTLISDSRDYEIISDLANSSKHGQVKKPPTYDHFSKNLAIPF